MGLTAIEAGLVGGPFLIGLGFICCFTSWCLKDAPPSEQLVCEDGCRLPVVVPSYWKGTSYWCGKCGGTWWLDMDASLSRTEYMFWSARRTPSIRPAAVPSRPAASTERESVPRSLLRPVLAEQ